LDRLLRPLLDSIALERGGGLNIRSTFFALNGLLDDVIAENHGALAERVEATGAADGWWDRDALFRVVENLLLNAVKYGAAVSPIHCRIVAEQDHVVLQVENSGPPIPEAEWETIFEPFTRGEGTGRDDIAGWGVGLAYARLITAQHGGSIRVSASTLQSTIFEVRLPLNTPPAQLAATPLP
jgi:signal transduction histidine kinase